MITVYLKSYASLEESGSPIVLGGVLKKLLFSKLLSSSFQAASSFYIFDWFFISNYFVER